MADTFAPVLEMSMTESIESAIQETQGLRALALSQKVTEISCVRPTETFKVSAFVKMTDISGSATKSADLANR